MRVIKLTLMVVLAAGIFSACDKCKTCTYLDEAGVKQTTNETCGDNDEMTAFESQLETTWGKYGTVACTEN